MSFLKFIWHDRANRIYLVSAPLISLLLFFAFKLCYPHPNMVMDSYVYVRPLAEGLHGNSFPMGYSWFLGVLGLFSKSATLLVWVQHIFFIVCCMCFSFTIQFFFNPGKWIRVALFVFLFVNPLFYYCSNFIMSDTFFTGLSLLWITQLIWLIGQFRVYMIFSNTALLLLVFSVRYHALYYPLVASVIIIFTRLRPWMKAGAIVLQLVFIAFFILYTEIQMKALTGVRQFSAFEGWKMANNALYMYGHVCQERNDPIPERFKGLDTLVRRYFNTTKEVDDLLSSSAAGGFYGGYDESPLVRYMYRQYGYDTIFQNFRKWGVISPLYSDYGSYLVRKYPAAFFKWYIWPNTMRYFFTPTEVFSSLSPYYLRNDGLGQEASEWFGLTTLAAKPSFINFRNKVMVYYPFLLALIHVGFFTGMIGFVLFGGLNKVSGKDMYVFLSIAIFWLLDLFFKVLAGAIVLRHQLFLMLIEFTFGLLFWEFIYRNRDRRPHHSAQKVLYEDTGKKGVIV